MGGVGEPQVAQAPSQGQTDIATANRMARFILETDNPSGRIIRLVV